MIDFILRPFRRNFGKDKRFYAAIDDMFGFIPNNIELYKLALIHKSASVTMADGRQVNNERLEYLGDAVIESVTSDYLFIEFPDMNEGFLTQLRSKMVSRQTLNEVAKRIGLNDYVITNTSNNSSQKHIYGDAFEAMMGAIYLDQGYDFVNRLLINKIFVDYIKVDNLTEEETDFKSRLIEWCQKNHHQIRFSTHNDKNYSSLHPSFYSKVLIDNIEVGYGVGDSKKEAEQRAAYSVAHGVNDDDCTKLMDKLDMLEAQELRTAKTERPNAKRDKHDNKESKEGKASKENKLVQPTEIEVAQTTDSSAPAIAEKPLPDMAESEGSTEAVAESVKPAPKRRTKRVAKKSNNTAAEQDAEIQNVIPQEEPVESASATDAPPKDAPQTDVPKKKAPKKRVEAVSKPAEKASAPKAAKAEKSEAPKSEKTHEEKPKSDKPKAARRPKRVKKSANEKSVAVDQMKDVPQENDMNLTVQTAQTLQTNEESA